MNLHYIGALQSRKIKDIVRFFGVIHSVDRPEVAMRIAREVDRNDRGISCLI